MTHLILNADQAKAVADAMTALNNVNGYIKATFDSDEALVFVWQDIHYDQITIRSEYHIDGDVIDEEYENQAAFFAAYNIN